MCLMCFLSDTFQYKLRKTAQLKTDRFEHSLIEYKLLFLQSFLVEKSFLCDVHETPNNRKILDILSDIDIEKTNKLFDDLYHCYLSWINAQPINAINALTQCFLDFNISNEFTHLPHTTFFRGRKSKEFISHWDMFHIPFNKRYLIGNQRYSLVGQPLLYLCTSPYGVIKELNGTEDIKISSFNLINSSKNYRLYNNTNPFMEIIDEIDPDDTIDQTNKLINSPMDYKFNDIIIKFYKLILSSCCSFEVNKKHDYSYFIEEYILPQLVAQIFKESNIDGIIYTSTKAFTDPNIANDYNSLIKFYYNYCLFTNYDEKQSYDPTYVYDKNLYNDFNISTPLNWVLNVTGDYFEPYNTLQFIRASLFDINKSEFDIELIEDINESLIIYNDLLEKNTTLDPIFRNSINLHCLFLRNIILSTYNDKYFTGHLSTILKEDFKCLKRK